MAVFLILGGVGNLDVWPVVDDVVAVVLMKRENECVVSDSRKNTAKSTKRRDGTCILKGIVKTLLL